MPMTKKERQCKACTWHPIKFYEFSGTESIREVDAFFSYLVKKPAVLQEMQKYVKFDKVKKILSTWMPHKTE